MSDTSSSVSSSGEEASAPALTWKTPQIQVKATTVGVAIQPRAQSKHVPYLYASIDVDPDQTGKITNKVRDHVKALISPWLTTQETNSIKHAASSISKEDLENKFRSLLQSELGKQVIPDATKRLLTTPLIKLKSTNGLWIKITKDRKVFLAPWHVAPEHFVDVDKYKELLCEYFDDLEEETTGYLTSDDERTRSAAYHLLKSKIIYHDTDGDGPTKLKAAEDHLESTWNAARIAETTLHYDVRLSVHSPSSNAKDPLRLNIYERLPTRSNGAATSISLIDPVGDDEEEKFYDCLEEVDSLGLEAKSMQEMVQGAKDIFGAQGFWTGADGGKPTGRKEGSHLTGEDGLSRLIRHLISGTQDKNGRRGIDEQDFKSTKESRDISVKLIRDQARPWKDRFGRDRLLVRSYITGVPTFSVPIDWDPSCKEMRAFAPTIKASIDHIFQVTAAWMFDERLQEMVVKLTMNGPFNLGVVDGSEQDSKHRYPLGCYLILLHLVFLFYSRPNYLGRNTPDDIRTREIAVRLVELFNVAYAAWGIACPIRDRFAQGLGALFDALQADEVLRKLAGLGAFWNPPSLAEGLGLSSKELQDLVDEEDEKLEAKNALPSASKKLKLEVRPGRALKTPSTNEAQLMTEVRTVCQEINKKLRLRGFEYELTEDGVLSFDGTRKPAAQRLARMCVNACKSRQADTPGRSDEALSEQQRYAVYGNNPLVVLGEWIYGHADDLQKAHTFDPDHPEKIWFSDSKIRTLFFAVVSKSALLPSTARRDHVVVKGLQSHRTRYQDPENATVADVINGGDPKLSNLESVTWFTNAVDGRGSAEQTRKRREEFIDRTRYAFLEAYIGLRSFWLLAGGEEFGEDEQNKYAVVMKEMESRAFNRGEEEEEG